MAATAITTQIGYLTTDTRKDVTDGTGAVLSTVNFHISGTSQFITLTVPTSALSGINANSPATLILSQGSGTLTATTTA